MIEEYETEDVIKALEDKAWNNGITILDVYDLDPTTSDTVIVEAESIFMNYNSTKVSYAFRLAHELSHLLYGDTSSQAVYHFSEFGKRGEELLAHKNAIKMLIEIKRPTSVQTFMKVYNVPSWLLEYVEAEYSLQV
ncbi:ImmA/IrrE family metallo-endopeptidase [Fructobacillus sp. M158]|uniref:ImmA/IrrE family metallo-endopeptidase n=1 Tax=Fructobacillus parabroussonetiae TaxID=2713174 RepID=UPI00200A27EC|nr:ImmA/IrrE family metallo-endopeptidase [Fructobacillus parabroussonetiae]MCK8617331.1 ImmA/IrrE family metallo-endopeptidase [Fructobacillus parabroussonetiae]